ncbi:hypothetical protein SeMB42_g00811 [Synchytrium endobioticum]|uniref:rRNA-processing protein EBP2 n=1 Tax=Synchytrium endobioticum TaxID=286115 RepID=A0A507DNU8_9FUNG|nr:hypothetical protein SeLEV6574_g00019 [Synchytrium endobioticum]TPX53399.1 hypothetical protein SeMB42_g00811 [Synchytrium endobioticum]
MARKPNVAKRNPAAKGSMSSSIQHGRNKGTKRKAPAQDDDHPSMTVNLKEVDDFIDGITLDSELLAKLERADPDAAGAGPGTGGANKKKKKKPNTDDDQPNDAALTAEDEKELMLYLQMKQARRADGASATDMNVDVDPDNADGPGSAKKPSKPKWVKQPLVNNVPAMEVHLERFKLPSNLPFIEHLSVTSQQPIESTLESPQDVHNDTKRELAIYKQVLYAASIAKQRLTEAKVPFTRPDDYFAEMLKSDAHMARVRQRLLDERLQVEQSEKARKLRDLKKFGKKVQQAKLLERQKDKKAALETIKLARKKTGANRSNDDEFDIEIEPATSSKPKSNSSSANKKADNPRDRVKSKKRQYKDSKYGYGGPKRHAKSNTAESTFNVEKSGFDVKKMKKRAFEESGKSYKPGMDGGKKKFKKPRLGKSKRVGIKSKK